MNVFNVQEFIDRQPLRRVHYITLAICGLALFIDAFDVFIIGKIAPAIAEGLSEPSASMTIVFLGQQIGLTIGSFAAPPLADRYGRKRMLAICFTIFGMLTLVTVLATSLVQIAVLRFIASLFLSCGVPMALSLVTEATPRKMRSKFLAFALIAFSFGSASGSVVAAWLLEEFGWQIGFWIGGLMPLLLVPLTIWCLPESLQYVVNRDKTDPRIPAMLRRIDPNLQLGGDEIFLTGDGSKSVSKTRITDIFREGRARTTTLIWAASLFSLGSIALTSAWLPTFFYEMAGISIQRFAIYAMIAYIGGLVGTLTMGWLLDRIGPSRVLPTYYLGLAIAMVLMAYIPFEATLFILVLIAFNFFQTGSQTGLNTYTAQLYPASLRSTGLGWASGAGRIGGIISPLFGGLAIASQFSLQTTLTIMAVLPLTVCCILLLIRHPKHVRNTESAG